MNVIPREPDQNFHGHIFYRYAFAIKQIAQAADIIDRFASTRTGPAVELLLLISLSPLGVLYCFEVCVRYLATKPVDQIGWQTNRIIHIFDCI